MSDRCNFHALGTADILDWRMVTQIEKKHLCIYFFDLSKIYSWHCRKGMVNNNFGPKATL